MILKKIANNSFLKTFLTVAMILLLANNAFAGLKTKAFFIGGAFAIKTALKSPKLQTAIINQTLKNPKLKTKAKEVLTNFIKNPKNSKYKEKAKDFYKRIIGVPYKIKGRKPINSKYAGKTFYLKGNLKNKYPHGVPFTTSGFPDFKRYVIKEVKLDKFISRTKDFTKADKLVNINIKYRKDNKLTWHHHQDGKTLQLIKKDLHNAVKHHGGISKN